MIPANTQECPLLLGTSTPSPLILDPKVTFSSPFAGQSGLEQPLGNSRGSQSPQAGLEENLPNSKFIH